jgi:hypothetical protein
MANEHTIKINIQADDKPVKSLKAELRETVAALQQTELGTEKFERLNAKAAELKDKMAEVNEQVAVFATGSKYEQVGNSLGEIGAGIQSLDFDRAVQGAKLFQKTAGSITFSDAIQSVKQLGQTFLSVGRTILTNPLFLMVAVVAAVTLAFTLFEDQLGDFGIVLKVAFLPLYLAIETIKLLIQGIKDLLDYMGLTAFAAEEAAEKQAAAQEKVAAAHEKKREKVTDAYDHEIRMAKIAGKDTTDLERQKQFAIIKTSEGQLEALNTQIIAMRAAGTLTKEKADEIRKAMAELKTGIREARQEVQAINAQELADETKSNEDKAKERATAAANRKAKQAQYAADRLAALRAIEDAELQLMKEGIEKERKENETKYARLIEDTKKNEKLLQTEKDALVLSLQKQEFEARKAIEQKYLDEADEAIKLADEKRIADAKATEEKITATKKAAAEEMKKVAKDLAAHEIATRQNMQTAMIGVAEGTVALLGSVAGKSKALQITALAIEKGAAIANVVINAAKEMSANAAAAALNPLNAATFGAAGAAQLLKANIFTKIRAGLAIATIAATGLTGAKSIASGGGGGATGGGGGATGGASQTPSMGQQQVQQTPQMNLNNGIGQSAGGKGMRERVIVVDYHDIQDKGNELQMSQQRVTLA